MLLKTFKYIKLKNNETKIKLFKCIKVHGGTWSYALINAVYTCFECTNLLSMRIQAEFNIQSNAGSYV